MLPSHFSDDMFSSKKTINSNNIDTTNNIRISREPITDFADFCMDLGKGRMPSEEFSLSKNIEKAWKEHNKANINIFNSNPTFQNHISSRTTFVQPKYEPRLQSQNEYNQLYQDELKRRSINDQNGNYFFSNQSYISPPIQRTQIYTNQPKSLNGSTLTIISNFQEENTLFGKMEGFLDALSQQGRNEFSGLGPLEAQPKKNRLIASKFSSVFSANFEYQPIVIELLNGMIKGHIETDIANIPVNVETYNSAKAYGLKMEKTAENMYIEKTRNKVSQTGFWYRPDYAWLGGKPDGIVTDVRLRESGLIEIKCPASAKSLSISEYVKRIKGGFLIEKDNRIAFDKKHESYCQVQGYLFILDKLWCDFVVMAKDEIFVERIQRDDRFIISMIKKLTEFYVRFMLPSFAMAGSAKPGGTYPILSKELYDKEAIRLITPKK